MSHKEVRRKTDLCQAGGKNEKLHVMKYRHMELFTCLSFYRLPPFFQRPHGAQPSFFTIHYISNPLSLVSLAFLFLSWYFYIRNKS
ncbi:MAG: hypothetical protein ACLSWN_09050, partial [[Clostridium] hylemonae]